MAIKFIVGRGASSEIMGGEFADGFKVAFITAAAAYAYNASTNYEETANWNKGGDTPNGPDGLGTYDENGRIPFKNNIFGDNKPLTGDFWDDFTKQGGFVSKVGNSFPGGGAISRVHDAWLSPASGYENLPMNSFSNYGTMLFAAALTYTALAADQISNILIV